MAVIDEIAAERRRQISVEGYDHLHDDDHDDGSLAMVAALYAAPEPLFCVAPDKDVGDVHWDLWPWLPIYDKRGVHGRRRLLVIAGALIVAEIERLDRQPANQPRTPHDR